MQNDKMKVLFLMFTFPDMEKSFNMYTTLVQEFHRHGHDVQVVAPTVNDQPTCQREEKGISVIRVRTLPLRYVHNYLRGVSSILLPYQFSRALQKFAKNETYDLIIIPTPPITLVDLAARLKRQCTAKVYLVLRDIFPQNAVDLGFMRESGIMHRYFRAKERKLYKVADAIGCMSQGNIEYVLKHNSQVARHKLHILQNYQILNNQYPEKDCSIKETYGLKDKFVVVFGGNMGKPQRLENVIELAKKCLEYRDVVFLLLGEGVQKKRIEQLISQNAVTNIVLQSTIPKADYQKLISACDIGLISLHENFTIPNIPSKILDYYNLGIPVLASIDRCTDFGNMLDESGAGLWSLAGDITTFKANFDLLYSDPEKRRAMGESARAYFEKFLTPEIAYETVVKHAGADR